ncbi:FAD-dependent oxidoreductase [Timonella sp. A28]|uniref:FAD-dependent oxidoreductase n=1 Tax=Timonella sp. A28 TaxID=3442640 RepID=UPI003EBDB7FD
MPNTYDVVVIGGGAMGSAAAWQLAQRGRSVALLEQFDAQHRQGSSHGGSRIYRSTYAQDEYLSLMRQALPLWHELESEARTQLLSPVGLVSHGYPPFDFEEPMRAHGIDLTVFTSDEAQERWPGMRFEGKVLYESATAGRVHADRTVSALHQQAEKHGADIFYNTRVVNARHAVHGVVVETETHDFLAQRVVLAAGGWTNTLARQLLNIDRPLPLDVVEVAPAHFQIAAELSVVGGHEIAAPMGEDTWPSFTHDHAPYNPQTGAPTRWPGIVYGLATEGEGIKVGFNAYGRSVDADNRTWAPQEGDFQLHADYVREWLPGLIHESAEFLSCTYTRTPTDDFLVDRVGRVVVASPCSGHGFKFTPVIGKLIADLASENVDDPVTARPDLFALHRFLGTSRHA